MRSIFLALTITTAYSLLRGWPVDLHPVLRSCFAVLVLVLGVGLWRKRERPSGSQTRAMRAARWPDYLAVGLGILAIECLFLFFLSTAPPRAERLAYSLEEMLLPERAASRPQLLGAAGTHGATVSGNWLWDDQGKRRLPLTSNAQPSQKPEVFFRPADRETAGHLLRSRPYLRAFAMESFDDSTWSPLAIEAEGLAADADGWISLPQPATRPGPLLRGEIYHPAHPGGQDVFTTLQGGTRARLPELRRVAPDIFRLNPLANPDRGYNYEVVSRSITFDSLLESGVLERFLLPEEIPPHLVELPANEEVRQALIDIAIRTQGPIEARLLALRKVLRQNYQYSLEVENPDGIDPILNFLVHEKRGHCEFFATAGALLCRALDIPSRVAYGWSGGRYFDAQDLFMFRGREAHAWTEVYLENVGWVVFDLTPPGALEAASFSIAPPEEKPPLDDDGLLNFGGGPGGGGPFNAWTLIALVAGLGLLPIVVIVLRLRKRTLDLPGGDASRLLPAPPGYLARFRQACSRLGRPMPTGRTLRQHLGTLARDDHAPTFADDLLEYHYAITYGNVRPDRSRESALLKAIKQWK